jgi:hypothetical protein
MAEAASTNESGRVHPLSLTKSRLGDQLILQSQIVVLWRP